MSWFHLSLRFSKCSMFSTASNKWLFIQLVQLVNFILCQYSLLVNQACVFNYLVDHWVIAYYLWFIVVYTVWSLNTSGWFYLFYDLILPLTPQETSNFLRLFPYQFRVSQTFSLSVIKFCKQKCVLKFLRYWHFQKAEEFKI